MSDINHPKVGRVVSSLESLIFGARSVIILFFIIGTAFMSYNAWQLKMTAGFEKMLPHEHGFIDTYHRYRGEFGGGDRITVALLKRDQGDIFTPEFFNALRTAHDHIFNMYAINRATIDSLLSPHTVYIDIVPTGHEAGRVVPADFVPSREMFERVRTNIQKADLVGRLVANDFNGVVINANLQQYGNSATQEPIDYRRVAEELEALRAELESDAISVHITGFAKSTTDIADGAKSVALFFIATVVVVIGMLYWYCRSIWVTFSTIIAALMGVIWQLGLLHLSGLGIDPMNVLIPFLVFAVGVSHAIQMMNGWTGEMARYSVAAGSSQRTYIDSLTGARHTFRRLFVPATLALIANVVGFLTLFLIEISIIQELALGTMMGMAIIIPTKLILLPVLLSFTPIRDPQAFGSRIDEREQRSDVTWRRLAVVTRTKWATAIVASGAVVFIGSLMIYQDMRIGDVQDGVSELRPDSIYNLDVDAITGNFHIGADLLTVYAQSKPSGCIDYNIMNAVDEFVMVAKSLPSVLSVMALSETGKNTWVGYNQGNPKWRALPRDSQSLVMTSATVERTSGLLNNDCSVMPIYIYLADHRAETIASVINVLQQHGDRISAADISFEFAAGNVGIVAATNEAVAASELPMMMYLFGVVFLLCLVTYRQVRLAAAIVMPLALISIAVNAVMVLMGIGLKVNTLPVAAIGVGIAVDYGIYICHTLAPRLRSGMPLEQAYRETMKLTGKAVVFIATVLAVGVAFWVLSDLQFQADMGMLLTLTFVLNGIGAIVLLPALLKLMRVDTALARAGERDRSFSIRGCHEAAS